MWQALRFNSDESLGVLAKRPTSVFTGYLMDLYSLHGNSSKFFSSSTLAKCLERPRKYGRILNLQLWCVSCLVWQRREMTREYVCMCVCVCERLIWTKMGGEKEREWEKLQPTREHCETGSVQDEWSRRKLQSHLMHSVALLFTLYKQLLRIRCHFCLLEKHTLSGVNRHLLLQHTRTHAHMHSAAEMRPNVCLLSCQT